MICNVLAEELFIKATELTLSVLDDRNELWEDCPTNSENASFELHELKIALLEKEKEKVEPTTEWVFRKQMFCSSSRWGTWGRS